MLGNWSTADGHTAMVYPLGSWYTPCIYHDRGVRPLLNACLVVSHMFRCKKQSSI